MPPRTYRNFGPAVKRILKNKGVGVLPTDTLYGLSGSALSARTVTRIYRLRKRNPQKPFIILISSAEDLKKFHIYPDPHTLRFLHKFWPGKVSVVLPCPFKNMLYLHRGTQTLAFRVPKHPALRRLLKAVGPLVSTSANFEGKKPALTIPEARNYFQDSVDFYVDAGRRQSPPSTLVSLDGSRPAVLRKGAAKVG
jgi:L-threonylcarbamoyladenylate synthase